MASPKGPLRLPSFQPSLQPQIDRLKQQHQVVWIPDWGTKEAQNRLQEEKDNQMIGYLKAQLSPLPADCEPATLVDLAFRVRTILEQVGVDFFLKETYRRDPELTVQCGWRFAQALAGSGDYHEALDTIQVVMNINFPLHPEISPFYERLLSAVCSINRNPSLVT